MADSELVNEAITLELDHDEELRWRITMLMTDKLLGAFNYTDPEKLTFITSLRSGFGRKFNESSHLRKQLGAKFKQIESQLRIDFLNDTNSERLNEVLTQETIESKLNDLVHCWYQKTSSVIAELLLLINSEQGLNCSKDTLMGSILHMHNNRLFKAYGREHELVMHDFLRRYYFSTGKRN
jgi:thiopeptide-type bacteriocin biosynthesis protein